MINVVWRRCIWYILMLNLGFISPYTCFSYSTMASKKKKKKFNALSKARLVFQNGTQRISHSFCDSKKTTWKMQNKLWDKICKEIIPSVKVTALSDKVYSQEFNSSILKENKFQLAELQGCFTVYTTCQKQCQRVSETHTLTLKLILLRRNHLWKDKL